MRTFRSTAAASASRFEWRCASAVVALLAAAAMAGPVAAQSPSELGCTLEPGPTRAVGAIIDGEVLRLDDGKEVRLLGIMAPRASDAGARPGLWPPEDLLVAELTRVVQGKTIALAFASGRRTDRYDRVLAHVFLTDGATPIWLQGRLLEMGLARAYPSAGAGDCAPALYQREKLARAVGLGLWSSAAYQLRPADRPTELIRYRDTFQVVSGRVETITGSRTHIILQLANSEAPGTSTQPAGGARTNAFRIVWSRSVARASEDADLKSPSALVGRNVRVRGWIEARRGPQIEVSGSAQLEIEPDQPTQK